MPVDSAEWDAILAGLNDLPTGTAQAEDPSAAQPSKNLESSGKSSSITTSPILLSARSGFKVETDYGGSRTITQMVLHYHKDGRLGACVHLMDPLYANQFYPEVPVDDESKAVWDNNGTQRILEAFENFGEDPTRLPARDEEILRHALRVPESEGMTTWTSSPNLQEARLTFGPGNGSSAFVFRDGKFAFLARLKQNGDTRKWGTEVNAAWPTAGSDKDSQEKRCRTIARAVNDALAPTVTTLDTENDDRGELGLRVYDKLEDFDKVVDGAIKGILDQKDMVYLSSVYPIVSH